MYKVEYDINEEDKVSAVIKSPSGVHEVCTGYHLGMLEACEALAEYLFHCWIKDGEDGLKYRKLQDNKTGHSLFPG